MPALAPSRLLFDFSAPDAAADWRTVDDVVMGGRSSSRFGPTSEHTACFKGMVSLDQGGGFASVRKQASFDLSPYRAVTLRVRGDGQQYYLNLYTDAAPNAVSYRASFQPEPDVWRTLVVPFSALAPTSRGRRIPDAPAFDASMVRALGFLISDRQAGDFRLELAWIKAIS
ncbi:MAG: CIA30 family protein [Rhodothermales bacterium]